MDTKFQKKHESDMTKKEKLELERQKLASLHGWEKIEYIVTYYKFYFLGAFLLVLGVIGLVNWADRMKDEDYLYAVVMNAPTDGEELMTDFREFRQDNDEHHKYTLDTSIFFMPGEQGEDQMDYAARVNMMTLVGSGTADIFICPESIYKQYGAEGEAALYDIDELMGEEFVKEHKDICEKDAIRVENNEVLKKYGLLSGEPMYLIAFGYTEHPDIVKAFIEFIFRE